MRKPNDVQGKKFGRLLVVERADEMKVRGALFWRCICDCGAWTTACSNQLMTGKKLSCGCLKRELLRAEKTTHGASGTKTFNAWCALRKRCDDQENKNYGGRGIGYSPRWESFQNFLLDMGEAPPGMTLEREDVNGDYEPGNCRWASQKEQTRNQRRTIFVGLNGCQVSLAQYCEVTGKKYSKLRDRIRRFGWSIDDALETP